MLRSSVELPPGDPGAVRLGERDLRRNTPLRKDLFGGRFEIRFQPIFDVAASELPQLFAFEALTRGLPGSPFWNSTDLFEAVRREGRERPADRLCVSLALLEARGLPAKYLTVNAHARTLAGDPSFPALIRKCCSRHKIPLQCVILEMIEHHVEADLAAALRALEPLRADGLALALDDLGAGDSSLRLLQTASPDFLKLDRRLLSVRPGHPDRRLRLLSALQQVAGRCGARAVAEGVESEAELSLVREAGIGLVQGFLLGRPEPAERWRSTPCARARTYGASGANGAGGTNGAGGENRAAGSGAAGVPAAMPPDVRIAGAGEIGLLQRLSLRLPGDAVVTLDRRGMILGWNSGTDELLGRIHSRHPRARGCPFSALFEAPSDRVLRRAIEIAEATGCWQAEGVLRHAGAPLQCFIRLVPLHNSPGLFALLQDTSALHAAEASATHRQARLEVANELYSALLLGMPFEEVAGLAVDRLDRLVDGVEVSVLDAPRPAGRDGAAGCEHWQGLERGETMLCFDTATDPRCAAMVDTGGRPLPAALLDLPILQHGELAAVLRLASAVPREWTVHETAAATEVGQALAVALVRQTEERRRADLEVELRLSRERLFRIADAIPGAVYQFQRLPPASGERGPAAGGPPPACGQLLFMSAGARHLFDLAPGESHTDFATILDAIAEEDRGALTAALKAAVKCTVEFRVRPRQPREPNPPGQPGATERWLQLNAEPEPPLADGSQTWNGVIVDISEIKAVQHDLARSRNEWGATVDSVKDMIVLEDPQGRILRCNLATTQFLRASFQAVVGCNLGGAFYGTAAAGAVLPSFRVEHTTVQFPDHADWFEIANFPLHDAARRGASWVHVISNVSARRSSEEQARRLSAAIEQTGEMLLIVSRNGILQYANPAYCNAAGEAVELLIGKPAFQLPLAPRGSVRPIRACVLGGRVWRGMFPVAGPDGAMHEIEATVSPVRGEGGDTSSFVCVGRDVTEPRRLEAIADAANMVDQVGFVFATLRHELGNPINSLKTALSVLHRNLSDYSPEAVTHYLERSLAEIARMEYLLRAFKTFGAFERPQLEEVAASDFLADFARLVGPDLERRGIGLDTRIAPDLGLARLDPRAFNQARRNLVTNAADAVTGCQAPCVRIAAQRRGRRIEVRVEDNGVGVAEGDLPNLFKPFYSTKRGGTGLGLAIVRKLLSKMGSTIDVRSDRGIATVFTLSLPVAEAR